MTERQHYTLSIAFTRNGKLVFIDKEQGPMAGKLIFPGGKVEDGEDPLDATVREFEEEIGLKTSPSEWYSIATFNYPHYSLHVCLLVGNVLRDSLMPTKTDTDEKIVLVDPITMDEIENMDGLCTMLIKEVVSKL